MSPWLLKVLLLVIIFLLSLVGAWLLPRMIPPKSSHYALFIGLGDTFSGGIILSAGLLHMLPEGMDTLEPDVYPFASLIAVLTILLLFSVDAFVHDHIKENGFEELRDMHHHRHHQHRNSGFRSDSVEGDEGNEDDGNEDDGNEDDSPMLQSTGREKEVAFILVIALSLHGFFEGLSIGTARSESVLWKTFAAIAAHKLFEAFSLGIRLEMWRELGSNAIKRAFVLLFCSITLVGGMVGIALQSVLDDGSAGVTEGIAISLAAGSFLYVSLVEVLPDALKGDYTPHKFVALFVGVAIFAALVAILP